MPNTKLFLFLFFSILFTQCGEEKAPPINDKMNTEETKNPRKDVHSFAQPEMAKTKHLDLNLTADFETKTLTGFASFDIENNQADRIIFDMRNLNIEKVTLDENETPTTFEIGEEKEFLGKPLEVVISPTTKKVKIYYSF